MPVPLPPSAPRRPHPLAAHGVTRTDDWYWLADRDDPAVIDYLRAENEYADAVLAPMEPLQRRLFEEIRNRVQETDAGPPFRHGPWWYFSRTVRGQQYPIMCRRADRDRSLEAPDVARDARSQEAGKLNEQVLLDENALAETGDYLAVGVFDVSPDHATLAYATDFDGSESYTLRFKDLASGSDHPDVIEGVYYGSAWAIDNLHVLLRETGRCHATVAGLAAPARGVGGRRAGLSGGRRAVLRRGGPVAFGEADRHRYRKQDLVRNQVDRRRLPR